MPDFDCYCAFCGVILNSSLEIGSRDPEAVSRREERLQRKLEGLLDSDDESDYDYDRWEEDHRYDPELVSRESLGWLGELSCIGLNADALEEDRTFFADAEPYDDFAKLMLIPGDDPNQPEDPEVQCYFEVDSKGPPVFPFHQVCYEIFERAMAFTNGSLSVGGNLLYHVMAGLAGHYLCHLDIEYGPMSGIDHCWVSKPGEEFTVTDPNDVDEFYDDLREELASGSFQISPEAILLGYANPDSDPFSNLPNELIREISSLIPYKTLLSLRSASRPFYHDTLSNTFWKSRITSDMPWLWDLTPFGEILTTQIDYMKLYGWLEFVTKPQFGVEPPFLAMANRRRIWQPCMELARHCQEVRRPQYATEPEPQIVEQARLHTLFKVAPIQVQQQGRTRRATRVTTSSMIWLYSWGDLEKCRFGGCFIESFWNADGLLTGLGVVFGSDRRILGAETGEKDVARIGGNDWISQISVCIYGDETEGIRSIGTESAGIKGFCIHLRSGAMCTIGGASRYHEARLLCTSKNKCLVGVEGHIRSDGVISRIGILEAPIPEAEPCPYWDQPGPLAQRLLWAPSVPRLWQNSRLKITPIFPLGLTEKHLEESLNPYHTLAWAEKQPELTKICRVSAYTPGDVADATEKPIMGLRSEFSEGHDYQRKRYIGHGRDWPEDEMMHMELNGADGERIVEIGVPKSEVLNGLMLKTNRERFAIFGQGEPGPENWRTVRVPENHYIQGIAATFGNDRSTSVKGPIASLVMLHEHYCTCCHHHE